MQTISKFEIRKLPSAISIEQSVSGFNVVIYSVFRYQVFGFLPPLFIFFQEDFQCVNLVDAFETVRHRQLDIDDKFLRERVERDGLIVD